MIFVDRCRKEKFPAEMPDETPQLQRVELM